MFGSIGTTEIVIVIAVFLMFLGPSQLPKIGRALADTVGEFDGAGNPAADESKAGADEPSLPKKGAHL
jgi:Sec-independent protein translocase protein TatA